MATTDEVGVEATVKGFALFMVQLNAMNTAIAASGAAGATAAGGLGLMNIALLGVGAAAVAVVAAVAAIAGGFILLGAAGVSIARSVESAFAGVAKTTNGLTDEFGRMNEAGEAVLLQFRELALTRPLALEDLLRIGELAGQLGIAKEALAGFSSVAADLAVTTDLTIEEATLGLARLSGIFEVTTDDMVLNTEQLGSAIAFLGNNFRATEPEILNFAKRVAAIGKPLGFSQADILGLGAAIASAGVESQLGGTAIQNSMIAIQVAISEGGDELEVFAEVSGKTVDEFARAWQSDAAGTFVDFIEGLGDAGADAFGILDEVGLSSDRTIRALLPLSATGEELRRAIEGANEAFADNTALAREAEIRYATFDSQLQIFKNSLRDVGLEIGNIVLPFLRDLLEAAGPLIDAIGEGLVPAFQSVFDAIVEDLLPALGILFDAFGFDISTATLTEGIADFGETIAGGIEAFSDFVTEVANLVEVFREGGFEGVLVELGVDAKTAPIILDVAAAIGVATIAFIGLRNAVAFLAVLTPVLAFLGSLAVFLELVVIQGAPIIATFQAIVLGGLTLSAVLTAALLPALALLIGVWVVFGERAKEAAGILVGIVAAGLFLLVERAKVAAADLIGIVIGGFVLLLLRAKEQWDGLLELIDIIWVEIASTIFEGMIDLIALWGDNWELFKIAAERIWELIKVGFLLFLLDILMAIRNMVGDMFQAGKSLMTGFWNGLKSLAQSILSWLTSFANSAVNAVTSVFQSDSPSQVFKEIGKSLMEGLALGIAENMNLPQVALDAAGANIVNAGQGVVSGAGAMGASSVDRSFNVGGMTVNARPQAPNRMVDDLALLAQLT